MRCSKSSIDVHGISDHYFVGISPDPMNETLSPMFFFSEDLQNARNHSGSDPPKPGSYASWRSTASRTVAILFIASASFPEV